MSLRPWQVAFQAVVEARTQCEDKKYMGIDAVRNGDLMPRQENTARRNDGGGIEQIALLLKEAGAVWGNWNFRTATNQAPRYANLGSRWG